MSKSLKDRHVAHILLIKARLSNEVKAYHHDVQEHKFDAQAFVSQIEPTIVTLNDSIKTERALRDEITEHCTKNASLENKVSIAQSELHDAREKLAAAARDNEEALKQKITSLDETIRDHSKASQETLDHVLSLEEQHNTLQETLQQLQDASTRESEILQRKLEDFSGAQLRSEEANRELAQVRAKVISLEERHSATIERLNKEHQREQDDYHVKVELDRNLTAEEHRLNVERLEGRSKSSYLKHYRKKKKQRSWVRNFETTSSWSNGKILSLLICNPTEKPPTILHRSVLSSSTGPLHRRLSSSCGGCSCKAA